METAAYRVEAYHQAFEAIRQELGAERWLVCGQSFGAGLTMGYALRHPERLYGQILAKAAAVGVGAASVREINELNIRRARRHRFGLLGLFLFQNCFPLPFC